MTFIPNCYINSSMANLNLSEITSKGKEHRAKLLVNKVFKKEGEMSNFATNKGLFNADALFVDGKKVPYNKKLADLIVSFKGQRIKIELEGLLAGKTTKSKVKLTELEKTEEFGGQPSGGKRINKGNEFEKNLHNRFVEILTSKCPKGLYAKEAQKIIDAASKSAKSPVKKAVHAGGANTSRPIVFGGNDPYITPRQPEKHGEKLTDITLIHANNAETYLSLKYGPSLTFMNAGVSKNYFLEQDMKSGTVDNRDGKKLLKAFGINNAKFCKVFNDYGKAGKQVDHHEQKVKLDKGMLKSLIGTAIGANYWMVHAQPDGSIFFWQITKKRNVDYSTVTGEGTIYYGGKQGRGKRIDLEFSNNFYDFQMNIRNKQRGLYPSHIMLDYTSKPATGKKKL